MTAIEFNSRMLSERSSLKNFALSLTRNSHDAHDLLQDTFLKALRYRKKFEENTNLRAWLFTIMKNTFINNYKREQLSRQLLRNGALATHVGRQESYDHSESRMNAKQIVSYVASLPEEYRLPFTRHYTGFKYEEIAAQLRLPLGTIKSRIFIARKMLMSLLENK